VVVKTMEINETALAVLDQGKLAPVLEELRPMVAEAQAFQVTDEASYQVAMGRVAKCRGVVAFMEKLFSAPRQKAHEAHKAICDAIGAVEKPAEKCADLYGSKGYAWQQAERKRKADAEAARQEAERKRIEDERLEVAQDLTDKGLTGAAERVLERPVEVQARVVELPAQPEGISTLENWQWEEIDLALAVKAAAEGRIPLEALTFNATWLNKHVKSMKGKTCIPGIRVYDKGTVKVQGAA
jgi:hypothetical protein